MLVGWVVKKEGLIRNEQPRLDDAAQRVVEAKYNNKLQVRCLRNKIQDQYAAQMIMKERKAISIIGRPSTDT